MFEVQSSRNNHPVLIWNTKAIHSRYNPVKEGQQIATTFLNQYPNIKKILIFGLGFGYHLLPFLERKIELVIYEPFQEVIALASKQTFLKELIQQSKIISTKDSLFEYKEEIIFNYLPYTKLFSDAYKHFLLKLKTDKKQTQDKTKYPLRVLIDFPIYGGSVTTATYVKNAFESLDIVSKSIDNTIMEPFFGQVRMLQSKEKREQLSLELVSMMSHFLEAKIETFQPDIIFFNAQSPITIETLKKCKEKNIFTIFWFVEDFTRFDYWKEYAPYFDLFAVIQEAPLLNHLQQLSCPHYLYMPMAACHKTHKRVNLSAKDKMTYGSDVSFMGAGYPNRRQFFEHITNFDFKLWGTDWDLNPKLKPYIQNDGNRVSMEETVKIYNASKININLHSSMEQDFFQKNGDFVNPRTFEILACGGFQLVDSRSLLAKHFKDGEHLVVYHSLPDLKDKIHYYLHHEKERLQIAENGYNYVHQKHTYKHRISLLLDTMLTQLPHFKSLQNGRNTPKTSVSLTQYLNEHNYSENAFPEIIHQVLEKPGPKSKMEKKLLLLHTFLTGD